ncbi:DUF6398 domain-containing protein [Georgenia sp. MJ173]|uniref:DUF6398 domain-containing protein n=1 Tax=Georgenia sunbinii TaxID=3117728 RepID=UPI002F26D75B
MTTRRPDRHLHAVGEPEAPTAEPDDFLGNIAAALSDPEPLGFLALASSIVAALDPRTHDPLAPTSDDGPDAAMFLESLIGHPVPETTALLIALAQLLPDNHLAQRARREAGRRDHAMPGWLLGLDEAEPGPAAVSADVLGDGQNTIVSVRLVDGYDLTAVVFIDHNLGTVAKDGFVIPADLADFRNEFRALVDEPEAMTFTDLHPAEARAQIEQAVQTGAMTVPRYETDTWPAARPIVEWIIGLLPAGGSGFDRPEWTDEARSRLADEFLRSPDGAGLTRPDDAAIAEDLLWFTTDYSGGSPWRWSYLNVQLLLTDWYPRKVMASRAYLRRMPIVLRAMVRYAHRLRQIPQQLTEQTLEAIAECEPVYLELIAGGPRSGSRSYSDLLGEPDLDELFAHFATHKRELAVHAVGSEEALAALDDVPLPDEGFQWADIPRDVHDRVADVLRLCDSCAEELFDVEMRTAFRRVLARTAATDPVVFRRRSKSSTAAAAIAWAVATVNDRVGAHRGGLAVKALLAHFGVTGSVSQRAQPFLRAFGAEESPWAGDLTFGTPDVLTADRRTHLIELRDDGGFE